jgi:LysR family transcriptional regulator, regulator of abg operon
MKLNQIRDVIEVASRGSLRSAARHLGVAQPAITRSIRELEHELGVALFERRVTGMVLTVMGKIFLRRASAIQLELDRAKDEIGQLKGTGTGTVAVGLSTASHVALLPRVLQPFEHRYPDVKLRISEGLFPVMEAGIQDGSIDFYVGPLAEDSVASEFVIEKLFDNHRVIVGRKNHPLAAAKSLRDLVHAKWVTTSVTIASKAELDPLFEKYGLGRPTIAVQAQTALSIIVVAASSDFLTMLPQQWLEFVDKTNLLQRIVVREELAAPTMYIVRRARLPLTPAAEHLCDLFRRAASQLMKTPAVGKPASRGKGSPIRSLRV